MKYLCLIYSDESQWPKLPQAETETMLKEYGAFGESIKASGHWVAGHRLHPTSSASTVRIRNGKLSTTDGPFAETKEQLLGFYVLDVADLEEALAIARELHVANPGATYEVRPVALYFGDEREAASA